MDRVVLFSATTYTLFGLSSIFTIVRILSRWRRRKGAGYGWDDWTSLLTYACVVGLVVADFYQLSHGLGQPTNVNAERLEKFLIWVYISQHFYIAVIFGSKLSVMLLYLRVWPERSSFLQTGILLALTLTCAFLAFEIVAIIQCLPIAYNWKSVSGAAAACVDKTTFGYSLASVDLALNVIVLLFPVPRFLAFEASMLRKTCIGATLLIGLAVVAVSAVRLKYLGRSTTDTHVTWYYSYIGLYSSIEAHLCQICCCISASAAIFVRDIHGSSRLSGRSRKSASISQSEDCGSGAVVGIRGIGPSDPDDPEKARSSDDGSYEDYERAPSPTIGLSSHRTLDETISSRSQFPLHQPLPSLRAIQETFLNDLDTQTEASTEDIQTFYEEDESPLEAHTAIFQIGMPSIVQNGYRRSQPASQRARGSTDLLPFTQDVKSSASRLDPNPW